MKKLFVLLFMIFTTASFGSGIASNTASAPCTNNTLETYSGNTNLQADWQPNTINLRWYNNNTLLDVQTAANTCTYDDTLTIPSTAPTRTGYTFDGWTVIPEIDFSTLPLNDTADEWYGIGETGWCLYNNANVPPEQQQEYGYGYGSQLFKTMDEFNDLGAGEWKVVFSWGTIYGMSTCSPTQGTTAGETGTPIKSENGGYCWCKATGYIPKVENIKYAPTSSNWNFHSYPGTLCRPTCAGRCTWLYGRRS